MPFPEELGLEQEEYDVDGNLQDKTEELQMMQQHTEAVDEINKLLKEGIPELMKRNLQREEEREKRDEEILREHEEKNKQTLEEVYNAEDVESLINASKKILEQADEINKDFDKQKEEFEKYNIKIEYDEDGDLVVPENVKKGMDPLILKQIQNSEELIRQSEEYDLTDEFIKDGEKNKQELEELKNVDKEQKSDIEELELTLALAEAQKALHEANLGIINTYNLVFGDKSEQEEDQLEEKKESIQKVQNNMELFAKSQEEMQQFKEVFSEENIKLTKNLIEKSKDVVLSSEDLLQLEVAVANKTTENEILEADIKLREAKDQFHEAAKQQNLQDILRGQEDIPESPDPVNKVYAAEVVRLSSRMKSAVGKKTTEPLTSYLKQCDDFEKSVKTMFTKKSDTVPGKVLSEKLNKLLISGKKLAKELPNMKLPAKAKSELAKNIARIKTVDMLIGQGIGLNTVEGQTKMLSCKLLLAQALASKDPNAVSTLLSKDNLQTQMETLEADPDFKNIAIGKDVKQLHKMLLEKGDTTLKRFNDSIKDRIIRETSVEITPGFKL